MKNSLPAILFAFALLGSSAAMAQCTINSSNTITGFTPASPDTITQQIAYQQTAQLYINAQYFTAQIISVTIDSIGGLPTGISYVINPVSGIIAGGADGAICFTGTTSDTVGNYPLVFYGTAQVNPGGNQPLSDFNQLGVAYTFVVRPAGSLGPSAYFTIGSPCYDSVAFIDQSAYSPSSWSWTFTGGTPASSNIANPVVRYDSAGIYYAKLVVSNQNGSDSITQPVTVAGVPNVNMVTSPATGPTNANGSAMATGSEGTPPYHFNWSNSDTGADVSGLLPAQYSVTITDANGCMSGAAFGTVTYTTGLLQLSNGQALKVYPNPATDVLNLVWSHPPSAEVSIVDLNGKVIRTITGTHGLSNVVDISGLVCGAYILRITETTTHQQSTLLFSKF